MTQKDAILSEMNIILDQLIENAQKLKALSHQVISEEEISPLQTQQQELLSVLMELDNAFYHTESELSKEKASSLQKTVNEKIEVFQQLNSSFLENIMNSHGLIQFKAFRPKKKNK